MRGRGKHIITNASGFFAILSLCFENFVSNYLSEWWQSVSWGWITIVLMAFWAGAQLRQLENGDHRLQDWWRQRRAPVCWQRPRYKQLSEREFEIFADVTFTKNVPNAVARVEVSKYVQSLDGTVWRRIATHDPINRLECNAGDTESIKLVEVKRHPQAPKPPGTYNALAEYVAPTSPPLPGPHNAFYRVLVRISGSGMPAVSNQYDFWWKDCFLHPLPLEAPEAEFGGDSGQRRDGVFTLWLTE